MSVRGVKEKIQQLTQDGMLDANDVKEAIKAGGNKVDADEMRAVRDAILSARNVRLPGDSFTPADYHTTQEAFQEAQGLGVRMPVLGDRLVRMESLEESMTIRTTSFGETPIPQAVQDLLAKAFAAGVQPFDVSDTERNNESGEVKEVFSHYPSMSAPVGNMAFSYTEITPQALKADMEDRSEYNVIVPKSVLGPGGQRMTEITYETRVGGTGNVEAHYDEGMHTDLYARGSSGQKWANNFAILSDGSIHALPAARRDETGRVILTNPALARDKRIMFMGHLDIRDGVVQNVEMSGRLCRIAAKGEQKFIDPISLMQAWGFQLSDRLTREAERGQGIQFSNTSEGTPIRDAEHGMITAPPR